MKKKFNKRNDVRKYTAIVATMSAMGAWYLINQTATPGISAMTSALLISYNSLAFVILYSIWGPKKEAELSIAAKPWGASSTPSLQDIKSEIRGISYKIAESQGEFKNNFNELAKIQTAWTNAQNDWRSIKKSTNELQAKAVNIESSTESLSAFESSIKAQSSMLNKLTKTIDSLEAASRVSFNANAAQIKQFNANTQKILKSSKELGNEVIEFASSAESIVHVLDALEEIKSNLEVFALKTSLSLTNSNLGSKAKNLSSNAVSLVDRFNEASQAIGDVFAHIQSGSSKILDKSSEQKKLLNISSSHLQDFTADSLCSLPIDQTEEIRCGLKTMNNNFAISVKNHESCQKKQASRRAAVENLSSKISKQSQALGSLMKPSNNPTTLIGKQLELHSKLLMELKQEVKMQAESIDFNHFQTPLTSLEKGDTAKQRPTAAVKPNVISKSIKTLANIIPKYSFNSGANLADKGLATLEEFGASLCRERVQTLNHISPSLEPKSDFDLINDQHSPEILISAFDSNEAAHSEPLVISAKEGSK